MRNFEQILRARRKAVGLSQSALATRVGTSQSTISQLENGTRAPSFDLLSRLAESLDVSQAYLLGETAETLSDEEQAHLRQLRGLSGRSRKKLLRYGQELLDEDRPVGETPEEFGGCQGR